MIFKWFLLYILFSFQAFAQNKQNLDIQNQFLEFLQNYPSLRMIRNLNTNILNEFNVSDVLGIWNKKDMKDVVLSSRDESLLIVKILNNPDLYKKIEHIVQFSETLSLADLINPLRAIDKSVIIAPKTTVTLDFETQSIFFTLEGSSQSEVVTITYSERQEIYALFDAIHVFVEYAN